jgi:hypothetical protein
MWFHREVIDPPHLLGPAARRARLLVGLVAMLLAAGITTVAIRGSESEPAQAAPVVTTTTSSSTTTTTTTAPATEVPATTPLATPNGVVKTYDRPGGSELGTVGLWYGYPMTMPVVEDEGEWLRIMLPERPNMSTAWVRADDVTRSSSAYRIVIRLPETRLIVYQDGFEIFSAPVGIGTDATPTAPGSFFVAVIEKPGPPGYGPLVLDTNGHSEAIQSWEGSGDAITAIHGPISARSDARIGTTGTKISNGCIRMHEADLVRLDVIPLGTPVDIIA